MKKLLAVGLSLLIVSFTGRAQFFDCTSGLLNTPSAEMEESGTFMLTNNFLNKANLPNKKWWSYNSFSYGFDITIIERVEIAYICTLVQGTPGKYWPKETIGRFVNQDRHFSAKFQVLKEGELWKWTPSIAVGIVDPVTGSGHDYIGSDVSKNNNGYFNRMYAVATKHFNTSLGQFGATVGYQYNIRRDCHYNAPCAAVTWDPVWINRPDWFLSGVRLVAEYDARTFNIGLMTSIWRKHFEAMVELQDCRHVSAGLRYRVLIK